MSAYMCFTLEYFLLREKKERLVLIGIHVKIVMFIFQ